MRVYLAGLEATHLYAPPGVGYAWAMAEAGQARCLVSVFYYVDSDKSRKSNSIIPTKRSKREQSESVSVRRHRRVDQS